MTPGRTAILLLLLGAMPALAQEPTFMDAATHPGAGRLYSRLILESARYEESGRTVDENTVTLKLAYGIVSRLALLLDGDFTDRSADNTDETGFSRADVRLKYRFLQRDLGPLNTWRASVLAGAALPGTDDALARDHAHPLLGAVTTAILGRHGLNGQVEWEGVVDDPDVYSINASYLYRLRPDTYAPDTRGAWYTMVESLNDVSDRGDARSDLAAGILYEAWTWAAEASVRLPLAETDWPREYDHRIALGARYLF